MYKINKLAFISIFIVLFSINTKSESYSYVDFKVGRFVEKCKNCYQKDGDYPAFISLGHSLIYSKNLNLNVEYIHRSSVDVGFPFEDPDDTHEYTRDGLFLAARYKFNHRY